jgi:hypothetical protein
MDKIHIENDFNGKKSELSKLIKSWNLIDMSSKSDFGRLSEKILSTLSEGQAELKIIRILESELCVTYGLFKTDFDAEKLTNEIMTWWNE